MSKVHFLKSRISGGALLTGCNAALLMTSGSQGVTSRGQKYNITRLTDAITCTGCRNWVEQSPLFAPNQLSLPL